MLTFNPKKKFFNQMLKDLQRVIWNQELKRFKALGIREQLRREYDQAVDAMNRVTTALEGNPNNEQAVNDKAAIQKKMDSLKAQIDDMDIRINGQEPTAEQDGTIGITQELEASIENKEYIKAFIKYNT